MYIGKKMAPLLLMLLFFFFKCSSVLLKCFVFWIVINVFSLKIKNKRENEKALTNKLSPITSLKEFGPNQ
jgi:hypothetical protein